MSGAARRMREAIRRAAEQSRAKAVIAAVSGGVDSMTLLHLLARSDERPDWEVRVFHLDHRMRPGSGAAARLVQRVSAEWGIACRVKRASRPVTTEAGGRSLRYRAIEEARSELPTPAVAMTAHTRDDQAETVLYRASRGAGTRGLSGILERKEPGVLRPLLAFGRLDVMRYAQEEGVPFREDPSNLELRWARNRIRRRVLPELERAVPGAGASLAGLAGRSFTHHRALTELLDARLDAWEEAEEGARETRLPLARLRECSPELLLHLLRRACARLGSPLGFGVSRDLASFVRASKSGTAIDLPNGLRARRALSALVLGEAAPRALGGPVREVAMKPDDAGRERLRWGVWRIDLEWGPARSRAAVSSDPWDATAVFSASADLFPLVARPWRAGDAIRFAYGKKKMKKILLEARIERAQRLGFPVVASRDGTALWAPVIARPPQEGRGEEDAEGLWVRISLRSSCCGKAKTTPQGDLAG